MGELNKSQEYFEKAYSIYQRKGLDFQMYGVLRNIAAIYLDKGELDKVIELQNEILNFYKEIKNREGTASVLLRLTSFVYKKKGLFSNAQEVLIKAKEIYEEIGNKRWIATALYNLVLLCIEFDKHVLAERYHIELTEIVEEVDYKNTKCLSLISEAIILSNSTETRDRIRAEVLFDQLLQEELNFYRNIEILFYLSLLLLSELKRTSDHKFLLKLEKNLKKLKKLASTNFLPHLTVECLWFESQLSLLKNNFEKAEKLLTQAQNTAEEKGLKLLILKIINFKERLIKQTIELEELEKKKSTYFEKMNAINIEEEFKESKIKVSDAFQFKQQI
jgi:tetratricopeptide (TPR) repeat protein